MREEVHEIGILEENSVEAEEKGEHPNEDC
jgi:hypothetical protein